MDETLLKRLVEAVRSYYEVPSQASRPLLLSRFGQLHVELRRELVERFGSLGAAVVEAGKDNLVIVSPTGIARGGEVVAPTDRRGEVEAALTDRASQVASAVQALHAIPYAVQIAFCVRTEAGERVALQLTSPYRYLRIGSDVPVPTGMKVVEDDFRRPGIDLRQASALDREMVWKSISRWAATHGLDVASLFRDATSNALARLLAAQPRGIMSQLVIPADILEILLRHD